MFSQLSVIVSTGEKGIPYSHDALGHRTEEGGKSAQTVVTIYILVQGAVLARVNTLCVTFMYV